MNDSTVKIIPSFTVSMDKIQIIGKADMKNLVYRMTPDILCKNIVNWFKGVPSTMITTEMVKNHDIEGLRKIGCTFASIEVVKDLGKMTKMVKKHRVSKESNPFIGGTRKAIEKYKMTVLLNCIWANVLKNAGSDYKPQENRENGIENFADSRVACTKVLKSGIERFYINYIPFEYLSKRIVVDENGKEIDPVWLDGFLETPAATKAENKEKEAEKHGLSVEEDPDIRQMNIVNIHQISLLDTVIQPTE